jgi:N-ethylmaleimide reductase
MEKLFEPYHSGNLSLKNRMVIAPMTRRRAENEHLAPNDLIVEYYEQRASAGLIVTEGSQVSPEGYGYTFTPGCYSDEQVEGWKKVTQAVHEKGGKIFLQIWHVGPYSHPLLQQNGKLPLAASDVKPEGQVLTQEGHKPYVTAKSMDLDEIKKTVEDFGRAAANAKKAGFDGVEIHGAHGYLIDQFLKDGTNKRTDAYGGPVENRARFLFEVLDKVCSSWSPQKTAIRLSPGVNRPGSGDADPDTTYGYVVEKLNEYDLAYLHISEFGNPGFRNDKDQNTLLPKYRKLYNGTLVSCGNYTRESAIRAIDANEADLIAFGKLFISNPDLVERFIRDASLNEPRKDTFYHGGAKGYVDYSFLDQ